MPPPGILKKSSYKPSNTTPEESDDEDSDPEEQGGSAKIPIISQSQDLDDVSLASEDDGLDDPNFAQDVQNHFDRPPEEDRPIIGITGHRWKEGILELNIEQDTGDFEWIDFNILKEDEPLATAKYIRDHKIEKHHDGRYTRWARGVIRSTKRVTRRIRRLQVFEPVDSDIEDELLDIADSENLDSDPDYLKDDSVFSLHVRRTRKPAKRQKKPKSNKTRPKKKKKPGRNNRNMGSIKYGIRIPKDVEQAREFDRANGNKGWEEAIRKEMDSLLGLDCFEFKSPNYKVGDDYQYAPLRMVFDVKQDLRLKARLVIGGHVIDAEHLNSYASTVKGTSVRLLQIIKDQHGLDALCGDVSNAFVNARTNEKIFSRAGPEFGDKEGCIVIIVKALYGLVTSAERWHAHFSDTLRSMGFRPTRYDRDVWIKARGEEGYDYICTHVDDFKIIAKDCKQYMEALKKVYIIKNEGPPDYYLGNNYDQVSGNGKDTTYIGCKTYVSEAINRLERLFGTLSKKKSPMDKGDHPELDDSPLLDSEGIQTYQMLMGMAQWIVLIGRWDIGFAVNSLSRFNACPREGHLLRAFRIFCYLKKYTNRRTRVDSRDVIMKNHVPFDADFSEDYPKEEITGLEPDFLGDYSDAREEIDDRLPSPRGKELPITAFFDSDHAHDQLTRRSCTGFLTFIGRTPVIGLSRRQTSVETSTYGAEFSAMRTAVEEIIALRYMLRSLGMNVTKPTRLFGDNLGVIQNASIPGSQLKKKWTAISYHKVRECVAAGIIEPYHISGENNPADVLTKSLGSTEFNRHVGSIFW